jgi:hypothetical protein
MQYAGLMARRTKRQATASKRPTAKGSVAKASGRAAPKKTSARTSTGRRSQSKKPATEKKYAARADKGAPVDVALDRMPEPLRTIAWALDSAIRELSGTIDSKVSWGHAGYKVDGHDLFAIIGYREYVSLMVGNGAKLAGVGHLLEGTGKHLRHVKVRTLAQAQSEDVRAVLNAALAGARKGLASGY